MSPGETKDAGEAGQQVQNSALRLYEVINQDGASVSPFAARMSAGSVSRSTLLEEDDPMCRDCSGASAYAVPLQLALCCRACRGLPRGQYE